MDKQDISALLVMAGSFAAYWVFCFMMIVQNFANG